LQLPKNLYYGDRVTQLYNSPNKDQCLSENGYYKETMGTKTKNKIKLMKLFSPLADKYLPYGILAKTLKGQDAIVLAGRINPNKEKKPIDCLFTWGYNDKTGEIYHRAATEREDSFQDAWRIVHEKTYDYDFPELK
jgi:hypothetical protein